MKTNEKLMPKIGDALTMSHVKVYLYENYKTIRSLREKGFVVCRNGDKNPYDTSPDNAFEFCSKSVIDKGERNAVLCHEFIINTNDKDFILAYVMYSMQYEVLPDYKLALKGVEPSIKTWFYLSEIFEENGDSKRAAGIRISFPVVAYVSDKQRQDWYFNNPANRNKTLDNFIDYAVNVLKKESVFMSLVDEKDTRQFDSNGLEAVEPTDVFAVINGMVKKHA